MRGQKRLEYLITLKIKMKNKSMIDYLDFFVMNLIIHRYSKILINLKNAIYHQISLIHPISHELN